jgi:hypothetical protein
MRHQPTAPEVKIMSIEVRPEFFELTDDDAWFFKSGEVPQFDCSSSTLGELLGLVGYQQHDVPPAGFLPADEVLRGVKDVMHREVLAPFIAVRMGELEEVATWAAERGRRVEWC